MKNSLFAVLAALSVFCLAFELIGEMPQEVTKNGLKVGWKHEGENIHFSMSAPTDGWIAIGFNTGTGMTGAYLLMGRVVNGKAEVVEHYTSSPGEYKSIIDLGEKAQVTEVSGKENGRSTQISFSLPAKAVNNYQRDLLPNSNYTLIMAYSLEDDFQHHSTMRTSTSVTL